MAPVEAEPFHRDLADIVGRVIARPSEIEVGIITALIGAPVFIAIVRRQKVREL